MIIELYGLPGTGKTTLARKLSEDYDFEVVKIRKTNELLFLNFIFFVKHPIRFVCLFWYVVFNSKWSVKYFYYKLMNNFLHVNAKYVKARRFKNAIIDQGYYQNIISLFEGEIEEKKIKRYVRLFQAADKLVVLKVDDGVREKRIKSREYGVRDSFSEKQRKEFKQVIVENNKILESLVENNLVDGEFFDTDDGVNDIAQRLVEPQVKIVYLLNARMPTEKAYGGQVARMCEAFSKKGAKVEIWYPSRKNDIVKSVFDYYSVEKVFGLKEIKCWDVLQFLKVFGRWAFYLQNFLYFMKMMFVQFDKSVMFYSRTPFLVWLIGVKGGKVVYECHDWFRKTKKLSLFFLRNCRKIVVTNNFIKNEFEKNEFDDVFVVTNGVDVGRFRSNLSKEEAVRYLNFDYKTSEILLKNMVLMYTGSFKTMGVDKGIYDILRVMKKMRDEGVAFVVVGGCKRDIEYYREKAKDLEVREKVFFFGRKSQEELVAYQRIADVMLMPFPDRAHFKYFMTPLKMFEYMASGRPIIASDLPSIREILNSKNSLFCKPGDVDDLVRQIKVVLGDVGLGKKIVKQALKDVEKYSWENRAENILKIIEKI